MLLQCTGKWMTFVPKSNYLSLFHTLFNPFQGHGIVREIHLQMQYTVEVCGVANSFAVMFFVKYSTVSKCLCCCVKQLCSFWLRVDTYKYLRDSINNSQRQFSQACVENMQPVCVLVCVCDSKAAARTEGGRGTLRRLSNLYKLRKKNFNVEM